MSPGLLELEEGEASSKVGCTVCQLPSGGSLSLWHRHRSNGEAGLPRPEYPTPAFSPEALKPQRVSGGGGPLSPAPHKLMQGLVWGMRS